MRKNLTVLHRWVGMVALMLLAFHSFGQGSNVLTINTIKSSNETVCEKGDGTLKIYFDDTSPSSSTYKLECQFGDGRKFSFDGLSGNSPIVIDKVHPGIYKHFVLVREADGLKSNLMEVTRKIANACHPDSGLAGKNLVSLTNCYGLTVTVDKDLTSPNTYINVSTNGATCIAYVDAAGNIGPSFQTYCIDPEKPGPDGYDLGYLTWTRVVGVDNLLNNDITELQAERINWVFCHESDYGVSKAELFEAEQYVMDSPWADWTQLAQDAIDAVPSVQGGIADKMVFFVPSDEGVQFQVQYQVVGECQPLCDNVTDAGEIGYDQTICAGETPDMIESISLPSGGSGDLEYVWLSNTAGPTTSGADEIEHNAPTYQPGPITEDTWFRRCSRRQYCSDFYGESNWIKISANACSTIDSWSFDCTDGKDVEVIGKGINGHSFSAINFPNPSEIYQVVAEVIYKSSNPGSSIEFVDADGNTYPAYRQTIGSGNVWVYRAQLPGTSFVSYTASFSDKWDVQSMTAYVFRNVSTSVQSSGVYTVNRGYNNIKTFSIPIPSATLSRDVSVEIPISELTTDGRYLKITADAGAQHGEVIEAISSLPDGCCFKLFKVDVPNVPGNVTSVDVTIDSRNNQNGLGVNGQSWVAAGMVKTTVECVNCESLSSAGMIAAPNDICSGQDAGTISNTQLAVGGSSPIEYRWLKKEGGAYCPSDASWTVIANSNSIDYHPGVLTQMTSFVRQARSVGCDTWVDESNCVVIDAIGCSNNINCDNDFSVTLDPGTTGKIVSWNEPTGSTNCPSGGFAINQIGGPSNWSELAAGTYTVTYEATDNCSLSATCSTVVTVNPPPTGEISLNCPVMSNTEVTLAPGETEKYFYWDAPTASTTCSLGGLVVTQTEGLPSGSGFGVGTHNITYQAVDDCLASATCGFTIIVHPAPTGVINMDCSALSDITVTLDPGSTDQVINWTAPEATTTCSLGGLSVDQTFGQPSGSAFAAGSYVITYTATDACLSSQECSFNITVHPAPTGVINMDCSALSDITVTLDPGSTDQVINWTAPEATTTCSLG
ncbi:MAG TPA: HYR domain-containing protein, partial [Saprospiraceae bacterium]|nr:HYR domain-containing protein [Saprospiraceae bacterium]